VDAALANRALDPILPRLLQRDPERLLDRMTLLLTEPRGAEMVPAMARLLRTIGVPVLNLLETRLYEARRQRVTAAIKLLAAADPERLLRGLARAMASWEWNLQDLAVSELSRPNNSASAVSTAFVFSAILADAHPMVVPMMIDQLGLAQETTAVPQLMEIAAGEHETLRDQYVRIKAIEALGRMRAYEAAELLRTLAESREGLTYAEPAGLRAAAEDALALIENRPSFKQAAAAFGAPAQSSSGYVIRAATFEFHLSHRFGRRSRRAGGTCPRKDDQPGRRLSGVPSETQCRRLDKARSPRRFPQDQFHRRGPQYRTGGQRRGIRPHAR